MSDNLRPVWIETAEGVREAAELCAANGSFALDTEADSMHSYFHKVCLIQVTAVGQHLVIDPLALEPSDLAPLWKVVGDPSIPVLMHGADYDVRILDRDYGALVRGLDVVLGKASGLDVRIADDPLSCVARGTSVYLENLDEWGTAMDSDEDEY